LTSESFFLLTSDEVEYKATDRQKKDRDDDFLVIDIDFAVVGGSKPFVYADSQEKDYGADE